jgi:hypothetical protein
MSRFTNDDLIRISNQRGYKVSGSPVVPGETTKLECGPGHEPLEAIQGEARDDGRYVITISSHRSRLLDEDNICSKWATDFCRYVQLLSGDGPEKTHIITTQKKVRKGEEKTIITIDRL